MSDMHHGQNVGLSMTDLWKGPMLVSESLTSVVVKILFSTWLACVKVNNASFSMDSMRQRLVSACVVVKTLLSA
jgi:hypothetical protein